MRSPRSPRLQVVSSALLLLCLACGEPTASDRGAASQIQTGGRPNLLVVLSDTHRADHVFTGPEESDPTTPNLRRIAALGTTFTDVVSVSPISAPSYASLLTGVRPVEHGVLNNAQALGPELPVLGEILQKAGYATSAVVSNPNCAERFGFARGFEAFWDGVHGRGQWGRHVTDEAILWLEERPRNQPFFLFAAYMDAHKPYFYDDASPSLAVVVNGLEIARLAAENRYVLNRIAIELQPGLNDVELRFLEDEKLAEPPADMSPLLFAEFSVAAPGPILEVGAGLHPVEGAIPHFRMQNLARIRIDNPQSEPLATELVFRCHREYSKAETPDLYRRGVASFDFHFGRLLDHLADQDLLENTVVVLLADHGEMLGEHGAWNHVDHLFPGTLHIPLIVQAPGFPAGTTHEHASSLLDIHRLILHLARGRDLGSYEGLHGDGPRIAATFPPEAHELLVSVQGPRFQLLSNGADRWLLFDIQDDPREAKNLFPELSEDPRVKALIERLENEIVRLQNVELLDLDSLAPEDLDQLRALGYL